MNKILLYSQQGVNNAVQEIKSIYLANSWRNDTCKEKVAFRACWSFQANLKQYNVSISGDDPSGNVTTGRDINKKVVDGLLNVQKTLERNVSGILSKTG